MIAHLLAHLRAVIGHTEPLDAVVLTTATIAWFAMLIAAAVSACRGRT